MILIRIFKNSIDPREAYGFFIAVSNSNLSLLRHLLCNIFVFIFYFLALYLVSSRIDYLKICSLVQSTRWSSSKTPYNFKQWIRSIALILPLSADDRCGAKLLDDLRSVWIGPPEQRKCFVVSIIPLWHRGHAYILLSFCVKKGKFCGR